MLVLSRKFGQRIYIVDRATGERRVITVVRLNGQQVRIGIEALDRDEVLREELLEESEVRAQRSEVSAVVDEEDFQRQHYSTRALALRAEDARPPAPETTC